MSRKGKAREKVRQGKAMRVKARRGVARQKARKMARGGHERRSEAMRGRRRGEAVEANQ
jgi:hypothetical protein